VLWVALLGVAACTPVGPGSAGTDSAAAGDTADSGADTADTATDTADSGADTSDTGHACQPADASTKTVVVTDIDATLTISDTEFLKQLIEPWNIPEMRPDGDALMRAYVALGYRIIYVTARGEDLVLLDGTSVEDATLGWLEDKGFPLLDDGDVYFAPGLGEPGSGAEAYKADLLASLQDQGYTLAYGYGNADSDVGAYQSVGVPDAHDFLVGDLADQAGDYGVVGISTDDAYTAHLADWMGSVPCAN